MCGILGVIDPSGPDRRQFEDSLKRLTHRGPDQSGQLIENEVALAHLRLAIIDPSDNGRQPMTDGSGRYVITYNGELYNFRELRKSLEICGHTFSSESDTEVILAAYAEYGEACVDKFIGMFALAIYDRKKKLLFLARDRAGEKPLYYSNVGSRFVFSSEIKAMTGLVPTELDFESIDLYFTMGYIPAPRSIFRAVQKLEPGHTLLYSLQSHEVVKHAYWQFSKTLLDTSDISFHDASVHIREQLSESVQGQLISDVPLGFLLSGGVDSSATVALAAQQGVHPKTFSVVSDDPSFDESQYSDIVANQFQTEHHRLLVKSDDVKALFKDLGSLTDEPLADMSIIPTHFLSKLVREHVTVAIGGDGADELFAGYPTYDAHYLAEVYTKIPSPIRKLLIEPIVRSLPVSHKDFSFDFRAKRFVESAGIPFAHRHFEWQAHANINQKRALYRTDLSQAAGTTDKLLTEMDRELASLPAAQRIFRLDMEYYLPGDILPKVDTASMKSSLEVRSPFLDHRLIEFVARLPQSYRHRHGKSKIILKDSLKNILPKEILYRKKKGFGIPLGKWIASDLQSEIRAEILTSSRIPDFIDATEVHRLLDEHSSGFRDNRKVLFSIISLVQWLNDIG